MARAVRNAPLHERRPWGRRWLGFSVKTRPDSARQHPRLPWWRRWFGDRAERAATNYLRRQGHEVLARNWRCDFGELDLVTRAGSELVFVEIRSTARVDVAAPLTSVDVAKQKQVVRVALAFLKCHGLLGRAARFDVVAVSWPPDQAQPTIEHQPHAFAVPEAALGRGGMFA